MIQHYETAFILGAKISMSVLQCCNMHYLCSIERRYTHCAFAGEKQSECAYFESWFQAESSYYKEGVAWLSANQIDAN